MNNLKIQTNGNKMEFFTVIGGVKVIVLTARLSSDSRDYPRLYRLALERLREVQAELRLMAA
jgi:hypothetical protein